MKSLRQFVMPALVVGLTAIATVGSFAPARGDVNIYFRVGAPVRPEPLRIVYATPRPRFTLIPQTHVYYVDTGSYNVYRYGGYYYAYDNGYWFRSRAYSGPWAGVRVVQVPAPVLYVPQPYRTHWVVVEPAHRVPPGHLKKAYKHEVREERREERAERYYEKHH